MRMKLVVPALLLVLMAGPAYPQKKDPVVQIELDVIELLQRVNQIQKTADQNDAAMKSLVEKMADQVNTLAGAIQKTNQAVDLLKTQNDATARDVRSALTTGLSGVNGSIKDLQEGMTALQGQMGNVSRAITAMKTTTEPLAGPDDLWRSAYVDYSAGNWSLAAGGLQDFLSKYPNDPRAADAHLLLGGTLEAQKKSDQAIAEYDIVVQKFPDSDKLRTALLKKGLALTESNPQQAASTLSEVVKKFPGTSEAESATAKLKELRAPARGRTPGR
jgi:tol-pal system protein YbgF